MAGKAEEKDTAMPKTSPTTTIHWDDSGMSTSYANVCNVSSTREEVTLLFGTNQTFNTEKGRVEIKLSDRLILNPFAAKRLSMLLSNVIEQYEAKFGPLNIES